MREAPRPAISVWGRTTFYRRFGKRAIDAVAAAGGLIVASPVLLFSACAVWVMLGRPVLFIQERLGLGRRPFLILKFRTMLEARDSRGKPLSDGERLTAFGRFLRASSLDELPELVNVLRGDMSLVGPRPLLPRYLPYFREEEMARFLVRPGITGLQQVMGRNDTPWDRRFVLDVEYVHTVTFWLDMRILLQTLPVVLFRRGLRTDQGAVMKDLDVERRNQQGSVPGS